MTLYIRHIWLTVASPNYDMRGEDSDAMWQARGMVLRCTENSTRFCGLHTQEQH